MGERKLITDEELAIAVKNSISVMEVLRSLGLKEAGGTHSHYKKRIATLGFDLSHFKGRASRKGNVYPERRRPAIEILVLRKSGHRAKAHQLVRSMVELGVEHKCSECGQLPEWRGNKLTLDVDHINENWLDNRLENLRFLCPNCHSQFSRKLRG